MIRNSFTLIELLIIISVIGIITIISIPAFRFFQPTLQLNSISREIISDLRYAQQLSITEQIEYCVRFFPIEKKYKIIQCETAEILKEKPLPNEITTLTVTGFTDNQVRYNPYGAVAEAGTTTLENSKGQIKNILVKPSGFVEMSDQ